MKVLAQESGRVVPVSRLVSGVRVEGMLQNNQALPRLDKTLDGSSRDDLKKRTSLMTGDRAVDSLRVALNTIHSSYILMMRHLSLAHPLELLR